MWIKSINIGQRVYHRNHILLFFKLLLFLLLLLYQLID